MRPSWPRSGRTFKIAVDARDLARDHRGIGRYVRAVLRRFVRHPDVALTLLVDGLPFVSETRLARTLDAQNFRVRRRIPADSDVVWHPWNGTFLDSELAAVATIHDAAPFRFPASNARVRERQQQPFRRSATSAKRVIAVSRFGAEELMEALGVQAQAIDVVYHGVEESFSPGEAAPLPAALMGKKYFLFIGDCTEPRKNFALLVSAFRKALPRLDDVVLAVISNADPKLPKVVHVPLLRDDFESAVNVRLRALYRGALGVCVPSYYETFGMPMIESMACATPVIASRATCLPEVGGDAALFVAPHDTVAWTRSLLQLAGDGQLRQSLSRRGLNHARRYRWDDCAAQTLAVLRRAAQVDAASP